MWLNLYTIYIFAFLWIVLSYFHTLSLECGVCGGKGFIWGNNGPCEKYRDADFLMDKDCPMCGMWSVCTDSEIIWCPNCDGEAKAVFDLRYWYRSEGVCYG